MNRRPSRCVAASITSIIIVSIALSFRLPCTGASRTPEQLVEKAKQAIDKRNVRAIVECFDCSQDLERRSLEVLLPFASRIKNGIEDEPKEIGDLYRVVGWCCLPAPFWSLCNGAGITEVQVSDDGTRAGGLLRYEAGVEPELVLLEKDGQNWHFCVFARYPVVEGTKSLEDRLQFCMDWIQEMRSVGEDIEIELLQMILQDALHMYDRERRPNSPAPPVFEN